jgi:Kef-type K+ transport system membrane component KefB
MFFRDLEAGGGDHSSSFGVHIAYEDLWYAIVYLAAIWTFGFLSEKLLFMPALVGQIFAGIVCGPELLKIVSQPYDQAFVLLGEIGLVLLVIEAGVDIDVMTLKLIGKRGVIIAVIGSIMPIAIGLCIAFILGADTRAAIAAGASFGPTSLGIAMNILRSGKIINTPTGQLIVAAAIIDDMIALIILSQLGGLVGDITAASVAVPIVSALAFLIIGGYAALFIIPGILERFVFRSKSMVSERRGKIGLTVMFILVIGMMQATHYTKSSHLMGAFIAGLVFCTDHDMHVMFVSQFKRVLQVRRSMSRDSFIIWSIAMHSLSHHFIHLVTYLPYTKLVFRVISSHS